VKAKIEDKPMRFEELIKELRKTVFVTVREDSSDYFEAVISKSDLSNLSLSLEKFFGLAVWPSKDSLSEEAEKLAGEFGGIRPGQVLYFRKQNNETAFAMLWPWQDETQITVKIGNR